MSFLDDVGSFAKSAFGWFTGDSTGASIARTAALGFVVNKLQDSVTKESAKPDAADTNKPDPGVREQVDPDTEHAIPVVYGTAWLGGIVTDAVLTNSNQSMYYCYTLCEKTGIVKSTNTDSVISFEEIYWNNMKLAFQSDGVTVASATDADGNTSTDMAGLVKFWCFSGGSVYPTGVTGYTNPAYGGGNTAAYDRMPGWTSNHTMDNLVFCIIRVDYNKSKNVTGLGTLEFKLKNTMTQPGDVLYDYMTNTRYGAGITEENINAGF